MIAHNSISSKGRSAAAALSVALNLALSAVGKASLAHVFVESISHYGDQWVANVEVLILDAELQSNIPTHENEYDRSLPSIKSRNLEKIYEEEKEALKRHNKHLYEKLQAEERDLF